MKIVEKVKVSIAALVSISLLLACSGTMTGRIRQDGGMVSFRFENTGLGYGTVKTALPDGEAFEGKFVKISSLGFGSGFNEALSESNPANGMTTGAIESYPGNIEAVLFGDKGHSMKCRFRVVDPSIGLSSGGVGICQVSDSRMIDIQF